MPLQSSQTPVTIHQLLSSTVITRVVSSYKTPQRQIQDFLGIGLGSVATEQVSGHAGSYDVFDKSRDIATFRAPGTGPATTKNTPIGHVNVTIARAHMKKILLEERIFRTRNLGEQWGNVDVRGQGYVTREEGNLAQQFTNAREFMASRMLRGGFDLLVSGDDIIPVDIGSGTFTVDYQIPSGHKSTSIPGITVGSEANIIDASWHTSTTKVITQFLRLNAGFEEVHGRRCEHCWINSRTFANLIANNTQLATLAGSSNTIWEAYNWSPYRGPDGVPDTGRVVVFKADPMMKFHIYDAGINVNGTYTKYIPDGYAFFTPTPDADWVGSMEGSEIVVENVTAAGEEKFGFHAWSERTTQPAGWDLLAVDNNIPVLYVPKCVVFARVDSSIGTP